MKFLRWIILTIILTAVIGGLGFVKFTQISAAIAAGKAYPEHSESVEAVTTELSSFAPVTRLSGEVCCSELRRYSKSTCGSDH